MSRLAFAALLSLPAGAFAAEYPVATAAEIAQLEPTLRPGDVIVLRDGAWTDQQITLSAKGTLDKPVTLRPATPGKAILTGKSSLTIDGEHLLVTGLSFEKADFPKDLIAIKGHHNRLTETSITDCTPKFYVHLFGMENRVDHCYLAGKTNDDPTMQVEVDKDHPNRHQIDHNHFGPRPPLGRNGGETLRVGYSHQSMSDSQTLVERNLFDRCDGELEIISSKSCGNVYRANTFLECAGTLTLRHGNRNRVECNVFLGRGKRSTGGIRVIGEDHVIVDNYMEGLDRLPFAITSGIPDSPLKGYYQAKRCTISSNTVVDCNGPAIELDAGINSSGRTLRPEQITVTGNVFVLKSGPLLKGKEGENWTWTDNISPSAADDAKGFSNGDPKLIKSDDGLSRPAADSPVRTPSKFDAPLTPAGVGPAWRRPAR
jgi:poly(beta-D-mannuronate) lyase